MYAWNQAGFPVAVIEQMPVDELIHCLAEDHNLQLIDVRRPAEFNAAHIDIAHSAELAHLADRAQEFDFIETCCGHLSKRISVQCSFERSRQAWLYSGFQRCRWNERLEDSQPSARSRCHNHKRVGLPSSGVRTGLCPKESLWLNRRGTTFSSLAAQCRNYNRGPYQEAITGQALYTDNGCAGTFRDSLLPAALDAGRRRDLSKKKSLRSGRRTSSPRVQPGSKTQSRTFTLTPTTSLRDPARLSHMAIWWLRPASKSIGIKYQACLKAWVRMELQQLLLPDGRINLAEYSQFQGRNRYLYTAFATD